MSVCLYACMCGCKFIGVLVCIIVLCMPVHFCMFCLRLQVCRFVCVYVCMCVCILECSYFCARMFALSWVCMIVVLSLCLLVCLYVDRFACLHAGVAVYLYVCMCVCF